MVISFSAHNIGSVEALRTCRPAWTTTPRRRLDGDIDADMFFGLFLDERYHVRIARIIYAGTNTPALDGLASRRIGFGDEDFGGPGRMRTEYRQRTYRSRAGDQDGAAGLDGAPV